MNVSLTPEHEQFVQTKVESGRYNSASEVVREALRLLEEHERARAAQLAEFNKELAGDWLPWIAARPLIPPRRVPVSSASLRSGGSSAHERLRSRWRCGPRPR